jgi:hypothetical protein
VESLFQISHPGPSSTCVSSSSFSRLEDCTGSIFLGATYTGCMSEKKSVSSCGGDASVLLSLEDVVVGVSTPFDLEACELSVVCVIDVLCCCCCCVVLSSLLLLLPFLSSSKTSSPKSSHSVLVLSCCCAIVS